jgi:hypothetical protein
MPHQRILKYNTSPSLFKQLKINTYIHGDNIPPWKYKYKDKIALNFQIISNIHVCKFSRNIENMCTNLRNGRKFEGQLVWHNVPGSNNCGANNDIHIVQSHNNYNNNNTIIFIYFNL